MVKTLIGTFNNAIASTANTTQWWPLLGELSVNATENNAEITLRHGTTIVLSNIIVRITSNSVAATSTFKLRKNNADGSMSLSIGSNATGFFEDTTNTDTCAGGDEVCLQTAPGAATGTYNINQISVVKDSTDQSNIMQQVGSWNAATINTASATRFIPLFGASEDTATEADSQIRVRKAGTFRNIHMYISANARTAGTFRSRKNAAFGLMTIAVGASATGWFEDTTNTDTVAVNDLYNLCMTTGTGTSVLSYFNAGAVFTNANSDGLIGSGKTISPATQAISLTNFYPLIGRTVSASEANTQVKTRIPMTISNLQFYISANTVTAASTGRIRVNGADGTSSVSIGASTTGWFTDTTQSDTVDADDLICVSLTTGGTGTSLSINQIQAWVNIPSLTRVEKANTFKYHIIGRVSEQNTYKYHILGRASKQNTLRYNILTRASKLNTLRYNIIGRVQKPNTLRYNIVGRVLKPNTFKYNIKAKVSKTNTFLYNIRLRVSKPNTLRYSILQRISKPNTLRYNIIGRVRKANTFLYKIVGRVSKPNTLRYNILGRVSDTITLRYNILGRTSKATSYIYNIRGRVSKPNTFRYNIFVQVKKLTTLRYNILTRISKPNTFIYNILAALARVSKPTTYKYNIVSRIAKPTTYRYNVLQQAQKPTTYRYNILSKISKPNTFKYNILQRVSKPNTFIYNLIAALARVQKAATFKYNIIARTSKPTTYRYTILNRISKPNTFKYNILSRIQKANTYRYNIRSLVQKSTTYRYNIIGRVSKTISFLYNILVEEAVGGAGSFAGQGGISQKLKKTYRPRQETVPPRRIIAIVYVKSRREFAIAVLYTKTRFAVQVKRNFMPLKVAFAPLPIKETPIPKPRVFYTKSTGTLKAASLITKTRGTFRIERLSTRYYLDQEAKFGMLRKLMKIYDMFRSL